MNKKRMQGVYVVEFAIIGVLLFTLLFGVLEMGRLFFTVGALNEVVRRGARLAAVCTISDQVVLRRAIFNAANDSGASSLIGNLTTANLTLAYLDEDGGVVSSPNDPANLSSIRFVQLSVVNFPFTLLIPGVGGGITLPVFRAILPRESLGSDGIGGDTSC
ncbi:TadE/TadG family type IV pilus assembly protein [Pseudomonas sp. sp1636]|uniref:TadE/TadG family type IV pilus assembly protein n=1 Tax=Pseudomonas sp. sp1636 TaxID=3036707 RepID=UPI0025A5EB3A|nr:TadE/TadG family type IV pilus assembly protein [Pseudomonas sp. sp1636]MDM8349825.1 TadE/TadG family type IV pilus assembly protein [Pseudomonas sp. sp1636]